MNEREIEERVSKTVTRPFALPAYGAAIVFFAIAMIATFVLSIAASDLADGRRNSITSLIAFASGLATYFFLKVQHRNWWKKVEEVSEQMWRARNP